ncbi:hypothetical protein GQ53DRAFT_367117 [Thozetella sp. PMI_491]|nr:hypothetical protein GQ53DRAFT_367117 [Thozetella sp. PMI_491]
MASGDTAVSLPLSSSPPPLLDRSPSNLSSPLSDVEDKGTDADEIDLDIKTTNLAKVSAAKENSGDGESAAASDSDDESKLSDIDVNDSEAETERLYNTPPKNSSNRDAVNGSSGSGRKQFTDRRDRAFERSPSKLQQQIQADVDAENAVSDNDSLSGADEDEDDAVSEASSDPSAEPSKAPASRSPSPVKKPQEKATAEDNPTTQKPKAESVESRKRKRSSIGVQSELEQPARKRTGSIAPPERDQSADEVATAADEGNSTNPQSGDLTGEEDNSEKVEAKTTAKTEPAESAEEEPAESSRSKRSKQRNNKKRKSRSPDEVEKDAEEAPEPPDTDGGAAEDAGTHALDGHAEADVDEEAEAAHRNEEESMGRRHELTGTLVANLAAVERKRAAWDELAAIEKQFSSFRERLYQERLEQLEREEAMLTNENPNHPEYLSMLQCIDERREERIRVSNLQYTFRLDVLKKRAVAERAQILSQFHQSVRENREKVLEELGEEWYAIQHERRRQASSIPDFGLRLPSNKTQNIRNAVAFNKEVSILAGFAKHVGFPAAPAIQGASDEQVEGDFEAISRARQSIAQPAGPGPAQVPPVHRESITGGLSLAQNLGPAGEQFIEQTPWANPNHPSHQIQRQLSQQQTSPGPAPVPGPSSANRRNQVGASLTSSSAAAVNGDSPTQMHRAHPSAGHESIKPPKFGANPALKQSIAQAS